MGSPSATPTGPATANVTRPDDKQGAAADPLEGFGPVLAAVAQRDHDSDELTADRLEAGHKFLAEFAAACRGRGPSGHGRRGQPAPPARR